MRLLERIAWVPFVFSMELRKTFAYRLSFWIHMASPICQLAISYFLWKGIFETQQTDTIQGFTFQGVMIYYLLVPWVDQVIRGSDFMGFEISEDVYTGSLNRYLVYPLSFLLYRFVAKSAHSVVQIVTLLAVLLLIELTRGFPEGAQVTLSSVGFGLLTAGLGSILFFLIAASGELVAFWADNVWSLLVMLRFTTSLLGGALIPLALFPEWAQRALALSPFPYISSFPVRVILNQVNVLEWTQSICVMGLWILIFYGVISWIWKTGLKQYSGVGI